MMEITDDGWYLHWCPGCEEYHGIPAEGPGSLNRTVTGPLWKFNGDLKKPTFTPSIHYVGRCHYHIRNGMIEYLSDCKHAYAGMTIPIPEEP